MAERTALKAKRVESDREFRERLAQEFLADPTKRAVPHPIPTVKRCALTSERGALVFDTETDQGRARQVPSEAHRRLRADERQAAAKRVHSREADLALHQEKLRYIADWVEQHGTADQRVRHAAGVLPIPEVVAALEADAFAPAGAKPLYERDGAAQLQAYLRQSPGYADVVVGRGEFSLFNTAAVKATAAQWALVQEIREALPAANVTLLEHRLRSKSDPNAWALRLYRALATISRRDRSPSDASSWRRATSLSSPSALPTASSARRRSPSEPAAESFRRFLAFGALAGDEACRATALLANSETFRESRRSPH